MTNPITHRDLKRLAEAGEIAAMEARTVSDYKHHTWHEKRAMEELMAQPLLRCHICGDSEVDCDMQCCETCNRFCCYGCSAEIETDDGDPVGVICDECQHLAERT